MVNYQGQIQDKMKEFCGTTRILQDGTRELNCHKYILSSKRKKMKDVESHLEIGRVITGAKGPGLAG